MSSEGHEDVLVLYERYLPRCKVIGLFAPLPLWLIWSEMTNTLGPEGAVLVVIVLQFICVGWLADEVAMWLAKRHSRSN